MRLLALGGVTIALIAFFAVIMMRVSSPTMSLLYSDLSVSDSAEIIAKLDGLNIPYELKGDGTTILVPKDEALRLRMSMAQAGLPSGGSVGYEIFDNTSALGTTSFVQNMNHLRALEGELARTIRALDSVQAARVHLVMPERELFTRERQDPTASIVIKSRGGLARSQAKGIQFLVASAVEGLIPSNVSIIDETGVMIAGGIEGDAGGSASLDERQREYENRLRRQVADIVTSVVGSNRARIQVAAEMDFNRITRNSETFDPEGQVVRSTQTVEESSSATERDPEAGVTVGNNLPDAIGQGGGENNATNSESAARVEETVNYEISRTTTTEVVEAGRIKRLSVAVLVDGLYETAEDGTQTYTARTQEELELIGRLVRSAIGFDETRGDKVEVVNLQLNANAIDPLSAEDAEQGFVDGLMANLDPMRLAELGALLIVTILAIFLVARPLIARLTTPGVQEAGPAAIAGGAPAGTPQLPSPDMKAILEQAVADGQEVIRGPDGEPIALANPTPEQQAALALEDDTSAMIDIAQIEGQVRESSIRKIGELVQNHPEESLSILRGWLHETACDCRKQIMATKNKADLTKLSGPDKAAVMLLALGEEHGAQLWEMFDDDEIRELSMSMSTLGTVEADLVEQLILEFVSKMSSTGALVGTYDSTERLLTRFLPEDRVNMVMEEIRGPAGRTMWDKLGNVNEVVLANYLKNEYPQTVAVVLSKIRADHAANVLGALPEDFSMEVVNRMLRMESVQKDILDKVEHTLRQEFMSNLARTNRRDSHESMAEIFNNFDRQTENRFMTALEERNRDAAERIKALMFTFEDLAKLDPGSVQTLLRAVEKDKLALGLKGASDTLRDLFLSNMTERAAKMLREDMEMMGPVRLKDVDEAQMMMVNIAKDLANKGEIMLAEGGSEDELIYCSGHGCERHSGPEAMSNPAIIKLQEATRFSFDRDLAAGPDEKPKKQEEKKTFSEEQVEQVRAEAYAAGSEAARADEELELSRQIAAGANLVADQLGKLLENLRSERAHLREEAADIALTIARKLVPALMDTAPAAEIENVLVHAFALLRDEPRVVVHVTPDQLDLLEPRINEIASEHGFEGRLIVRVDEEIALGDVRIEWSKGHITRDTPALDSEIETIVRTYLSAPGTDDNGQTDFFALLGKQ